MGGKQDSWAEVSPKDYVRFTNCPEVNYTNMDFAKIGGTFLIEGSKFMNSLKLDSAAISNCCEIENSEFKDAMLNYVKVGGVVSINCSRFSGKLSMNSLSAARSFFIKNKSEINNANLVGIKVGDQLLFDNSLFRDELLAASADVGENIIINLTKLEKGLNLSNSSINGSIFFYNSDLSDIDLGGSLIKGEIHLGSPLAKNKWKTGSTLNLRNVSAASFQDAGDGDDVWGNNLNINGFSYSSIGGYHGQKDESDSEIAERDEKWFIRWLERNYSFSPQPYHQIAGILNSMGYPEKANTILYTCKNREKKEALRKGNHWKWLGMSIIDWTIGYGFGPRYFRSLIWVGALSFLGVLVMYTLPEAQLVSTSTEMGSVLITFWGKLGFSIDRLLPLVWLDERFRFTFNGWQLYYFYFHQLVGFMLGTFVVAGLSGITKR
jgi:hypothetical protein